MKNKTAHNSGKGIDKICLNSPTWMAPNKNSDYLFVYCNDWKK